MEILIYTVPAVKFIYPDPDTFGIDANYSFNGGAFQSLQVDTDDDAKVATATLPFQDGEGRVVIQWNFSISSGSYSKTEEYDVITPLLSDAQVRVIIGDTATDEEVHAAEASARYIIQGYTGQTFGKFIGGISVTGSGDTTLRLPKRLTTLTSINDNAILPQWVAVRGGGWYIVSKFIHTPTLRADFDGWHQDTNTGVITAPPRWARAYTGFIAQVEYLINGIWGWDSVPPMVVEAAKLLVNDYACGDSIYRDRFITQVSGPDWALEFNDGAFTSTGNVRADALLADYKLRRGWQVI